MDGGGIKQTSSISLVTAFLWSVLLVQNHEGIALDPNKALTQYGHAVWQDKDGLPQNTVRVITQTRDGYLWIGTEGGLARFDGVRFTVFDRVNTKEIRNNSISTLCARHRWLWRRGASTVCASSN